MCTSLYVHQVSLLLDRCSDGAQALRRVGWNGASARIAQQIRNALWRDATPGCRSHSWSCSGCATSSRPHASEGHRGTHSSRMQHSSDADAPPAVFRFCVSERDASASSSVSAVPHRTCRAFLKSNTQSFATKLGSSNHNTNNPKTPTQMRLLKEVLRSVLLRRAVHFGIPAHSNTPLASAPHV